MRKTSDVDLVLLNSAGRLESIARAAESVDASVPILSGIAANGLYALLGATRSNLPHVSDHPQAIAWLLDGVAAKLSGLARNPALDDVLYLVRAARRHLDVA